MSELEIMTPELAASKVREVAKAWGNAWNGRKDPEMVAVHKADAKDIRMVATLIRKRKFAEAREAIYCLDTIVRDEIPSDIWAWLRC